MSSNNAILGLVAQTPIHAGTGSSIDVIDLPIQREAHTGYPCIFGSAAKGALRTLAEQNQLSTIGQVFGPDINNASDHAGALIVHDAKIALLPIRSLSSSFCWICSPYVIKRIARDCQLLELEFNIELQTLLRPVSDQQAICHGEPKENEHLYLEEYLFSVHRQDLSELISVLSTLFKRDDADSELKSQLVIVSDDTFAYLAQHATPVNAHIAIEPSTKTVKPGALWYEETLPPETVLYLGLTANDSRDYENSTKLDSKQVLQAALGLFKDHPWLQIGGNETLGMGWCHVQTIESSATGKG